jgi:hypothetical protein
MDDNKNCAGCGERPGVATSAPLGVKADEHGKACYACLGVLEGFRDMDWPEKVRRIRALEAAPSRRVVQDVPQA